MFYEDSDDEPYIVLGEDNFEVKPVNSRMRKLRPLRTVPTHTEDGIPIRKLYVSNLPPKTNRKELFAVFAQFGFIESCWLRMDLNTETHAYAFVKFSDANDAHRALRSSGLVILRGKTLRIYPADSWHQPNDDLDTFNRYSQAGSSKNAVEEEDCTQSYTILDILNGDCLSHILTYVPIRDLIRSERVSKRWQAMIQDYLQGLRLFKTSWLNHAPVKLTTAVLRRLLAQFGGSLLRLHIDHHCSELNDRTAHTVGKFCPLLEELTIVCMHTKNWNPLKYGCKRLKSLSFITCNKLTDRSLKQLVQNDSSIESLTVTNNTHVTGQFLTGSGSGPSRLSSLAFHNCYSLQGKVLGAALDALPALTALKLDVCPVTVWKTVPAILRGLPGLRELSLSGYSAAETRADPLLDERFREALAGLSRLKILNLSKNANVTDEVLKTVGRSCPELESLDASSCNGARARGVGGAGDEGVAAACACAALRRLDVSYLAALSDRGLAAAALLPQLTALVARGNPALTSAPFALLLGACPLLRELDACGCDAVGEDLRGAAAAALRARPRPLVLRLSSTAAAARAAHGQQELESHPLLSVDVTIDRCVPQLRPDFRDLFHNSDDGYYNDSDIADDYYNDSNSDDNVNYEGSLI